ncbi:hypothetical protein FOL47_003618 [Perkinsus chesapeaki]|uniref:Uncharacterized protein n=1 Tax=Perkinsus chesapeaki TaxID=330153 RepID=A0A7J6M6X8_PERCH|nr:hypothetical protein FOL47_003618 [Perkinsus chesapeaki]
MSSSSKSRRKRRERDASERPSREARERPNRVRELPVKQKQAVKKNRVQSARGAGPAASPPSSSPGPAKARGRWSRFVIEGFNLLGEVMISDNYGGAAFDAMAEAARLEKIKVGRQKVLKGLLMSNTTWINDQVICTTSTNKARDVSCNCRHHTALLTVQQSFLPSAPEYDYITSAQEDRLVDITKPRHAVISVDYGGSIGLMTRPALARAPGAVNGLASPMSPVSGYSAPSPRDAGMQEVGGRFMRYWQGAVTGDTALHMAVRAHDRLLVAALLLMGADIDARNGQGVIPENALKFNPADRLDAGLRMGSLDPRIGGRGYLEGLYLRVAKPGTTEEPFTTFDSSATTQSANAFEAAAAAAARVDSLVTEGTLWQEEILMSIQRFSAYNKAPMDAAQLEIGSDIIASLCRRGAVEGALSSSGPRFKWLVLASEANAIRMQAVKRGRPRRDEFVTKPNVWSETRVWMGKHEEIYPGGPSRLLSLPEAAEHIAVAERSGGLGVLWGGHSRSGGIAPQAPQNRDAPLTHPTQRMLRLMMEEEKKAAATKSVDIISEGDGDTKQRHHHHVTESDILPAEGEMLRYRGIRFGNARSTLFQSSNLEIVNGDSLLHVAIRMKNFYLIRFLLACAAARGRMRAVMGLKNSEGVTCKKLSETVGLGRLGEMCPKLKKAKKHKKGLPIIEFILSVLRFARPQGKQSGKLSQFLSLKKKYGTYQIKTKKKR